MKNAGGDLGGDSSATSYQTPRPRAPKNEVAESQETTFGAGCGVRLLSAQSTDVWWRARDDAPPAIVARIARRTRCGRPRENGRTLRCLQIRARRRRSAFATTETELRLIAAAAIIGFSRIPNQG